MRTRMENEPKPAAQDRIPMNRPCRICAKNRHRDGLDLFDFSPVAAEHWRCNIGRLPSYGTLPGTAYGYTVAGRRDERGVADYLGVLCV